MIYNLCHFKYYVYYLSVFHGTLTCSALKYGHCDLTALSFVVFGHLVNTSNEANATSISCESKYAVTLLCKCHLMSKL